ncbi:hypothetical protein [Streptomyces sp. TLI_105]|uniref:hypothetical protein n=1 Tax=Streptomyces sp. TLI_105 TaxID=1881019 RepID=UPI000897AA9C|nr:hypothetical protein [Streptomyces sp. TLI_105]SEB61473.1 hypothetical protein SAMN05428939_0198 [Streptomyces sp. TLI_105]
MLPDEAIPLLRTGSTTPLNHREQLGRAAGTVRPARRAPGGCGGEEDWDLYRMRLPLIAARDGVDEAIAQARSHPEGATWYAAAHIAERLAGAGRTEEAVAVLRPHAPSNRHDLAGSLIGLGRTEEASTSAAPKRPWPSCTRTSLVRHSPRPLPFGAKNPRPEGLSGATPRVGRPVEPTASQGAQPLSGLLSAGVTDFERGGPVGRAEERGAGQADAGSWLTRTCPPEAPAK